MAKKKKHNRSGNPQKQHHHHALKKPVKPVHVSWVAGARPKTLALAVAPVAIGVGVVVRAHSFSWVLSALALAVALLMQIGVNYANDYSDGVRGTDEERVGPGRLVGSGSQKPRTVLTVALVFFGLAAVAGIVIVLLTQLWWILAVGALAIIAAWFYTGGKRPYGYSGLGEIVVFIFFGPVAVMGTAFIQMKVFSQWAFWGGVAVGLLAAAVLLINNIRDIATDAQVGKKTLAVRMGRRLSVGVFCSLLAIPMILIGAGSILFTSLVYVQFLWLVFLPAAVIAIWAKSAAEYVLVLTLTTAGTLGFGVLLGLMIGQPWIQV